MGGGGPPGPGRLEFEPFFSAALRISSSRRLRAAHRTTHSTQSSLPSPSVCQTAFSSGVLPVMAILVPPPLEAGFFWILPNSIRLGGIKWPA